MCPERSEGGKQEGGFFRKIKEMSRTQPRPLQSQHLHPQDPATMIIVSPKSVSSNSPPNKSPMKSVSSLVPLATELFQKGSSLSQILSFVEAHYLEKIQLLEQQLQDKLLSGVETQTLRFMYEKEHTRASELAKEVSQLTLRHSRIKDVSKLEADISEKSVLFNAPSHLFPSPEKKSANGSLLLSKWKNVIADAKQQRSGSITESSESVPSPDGKQQQRNSTVDSMESSINSFSSPQKKAENLLWKRLQSKKLEEIKGISAEEMRQKQILEFIDSQPFENLSAGDLRLKVDSLEKINYSLKKELSRMHHSVSLSSYHRSALLRDCEQLNGRCMKAEDELSTLRNELEKTKREWLEDVAAFDKTKDFYERKIQDMKSQARLQTSDARNVEDELHERIAELHRLLERERYEHKQREAHLITIIEEGKEKLDGKLIRTFDEHVEPLRLALEEAQADSQQARRELEQYKRRAADANIYRSPAATPRKSGVSNNNSNASTPRVRQMYFSGAVDPSSKHLFQQQQPRVQSTMKDEILSPHENNEKRQARGDRGNKNWNKNVVMVSSTSTTGGGGVVLESTEAEKSRQEAFQGLLEMSKGRQIGSMVIPGMNLRKATMVPTKSASKYHQKEKGLPSESSDSSLEDSSCIESQQKGEEKVEVNLCLVQDEDYVKEEIVGDDEDDDDDDDSYRSKPKFAMAPAQQGGVPTPQKQKTEVNNDKRQNRLINRNNPLSQFEREMKRQIKRDQRQRRLPG